MKRPALQSKPVGVLEMAFQTQKVFGTFEKRAPVPFCFESLWSLTTTRYFVFPCIQTYAVPRYCGLHWMQINKSRFKTQSFETPA